MKTKKNIDVELPRLIKSEDGKVWYVQFRCFYEKTDRLERFRHYKGFSKRKTEDQKQKFADDLITDYSQKLVGGWRPWAETKFIYKDEIEYKVVAAGFGKNRNDSSHLRKHLSEFLKMRKREVGEKTYESYSSKTRLFCQWLEKNGHENIKVYEITQQMVIEFFSYLIDHRKLDRITIRGYKQNLGQMFKYFKIKKLTDVLFPDEIPMPPKTKDFAARPIMEADLQDLLIYFAKNDPQLFLASLMQFFLCCRPGKELRLLKIQDIDISNRQVYITEEDAKKSRRIITMPDALIEICMQFELNKYPHEYFVFGQGGKPNLVSVGKNYLTNHFNKGRTRFNLPKTYKFYSLKHTGAGKILESGATMSELKNHLGHSSFESTLRYVHRHFGEKSEKIVNFKPAFLNRVL